MSEKYGPWIPGPPPQFCGFLTSWEGREIHKMVHRTRVVGDEIMVECQLCLKLPPKVDEARPSPLIGGRHWPKPRGTR